MQSIVSTRTALAAASGPELTGLIKTIIKKWPVVIFAKSWCHFCDSAKATLAAAGASESRTFSVDLDKIGNESAIQAALAEISKQRTVPNIYIGQVHVGGNSDLQALARQKELTGRIEEAVRKAEQAEAEGEADGGDKKL